MKKAPTDKTFSILGKRNVARCYSVSYILQSVDVGGRGIPDQPYLGH